MVYFRVLKTKRQTNNKDKGLNVDTVQHRLFSAGSKIFSGLRKILIFAKNEKSFTKSSGASGTWRSGNWREVSSKSHSYIFCLPQTSSCGGLKELFTKVILLFLFHSELTAFISESRAGYDDSKCTLKEDGIGFELAGLAFALQKNSSWTASISRAIHKLKAQDTITEIFNKWTTSRCKTSQQSVVAHRMGLDEFEGFLFNTAMITLGCFLILLLEVFFYRRITRARRSFSPEQNGTALNAAKLPRVSTTND